MDYLLDTHVVIWFITNDSKLPLFIKSEIENLENKCYVSIASFWEIGIKNALGRLELGSDLETIFALINKSGLEVLPITQNHILSSSKLQFHHNDSFDRLLIAQSITENLTLISKDRAFKQYKATVLWEKE
jgi:PIN domain nuclease of toxin-antitoxin system